MDCIASTSRVSEGSDRSVISENLPDREFETAPEYTERSLRRRVFRGDHKLRVSVTDEYSQVIRSVERETPDAPPYFRVEIHTELGGSDAMTQSLADPAGPLPPSEAIGIPSIWQERKNWRINYTAPNLDRDTVATLHLDQIKLLVDAYGDALTCKFCWGCPGAHVEPRH
jgi:hypothetical protein